MKKTRTLVKAWAIVNRGKIMSVNQDRNLELYATQADAARALKDIKRLAWAKGAPKVVFAEITIYKNALPPEPAGSGTES
jgi:hypothetical protein